MVKRKVIQQRGPLGNLLSSYEEEAEEDAILRDGETLRVAMYLRDGSPNPALSEVQRLVAASQNQLLVSDGTDNALNLHKPGFRYSTDPAARAAADAALTEAYEARELADRDAWRSHDDHPLLPQGRIGDKQHDAQSVTDAYAEYDREAESAWRNG